jgi:hypothetical protein
MAEHSFEYRFARAEVEQGKQDCCAKQDRRRQNAAPMGEAFRLHVWNQ